MNVTCHVVEDLMPLYAEQLASQDSRLLIEDHLKHCPSCRARLEAISQPTPLPADRDTAPLKKLRSKLRKRQLLTVLISVLCALALTASVLSFAFSPDYIPYREDLLRIEEQDASLYLISQQPVSGYEMDCYSTPQGQVYHITLYQTLWDRIFDSFRTSSWCFNPKGEKIAAVYYASNDGTDDIFLYGKNQYLSGGVRSLPRLALGYYLILAAGLAGGLVLLSAGLGRWQTLAVRLRYLSCLPISYVLSHLCVMGLSTVSYSILWDFSAIVLVSLPLCGALMLSYYLLRTIRKAKLAKKMGDEGSGNMLN